MHVPLLTTEKDNVTLQPVLVLTYLMHIRLTEFIHKGLLKPIKNKDIAFCKFYDLYRAFAGAKPLIYYIPPVNQIENLNSYSHPCATFE